MERSVRVLGSMATNQKFRLMRDHFHDAAGAQKKKKSTRTRKQVRRRDARTNELTDSQREQGWERDRGTKRQPGNISKSSSIAGIMQNSICNLNVFILRYAGAIFIFTENEGFTNEASRCEPSRAGDWVELKLEAGDGNGTERVVHNTQPGRREGNQWASPPSIFQSYWAFKSVCRVVRMKRHRLVCRRKLLIYKQNVIFTSPHSAKKPSILPKKNYKFEFVLSLI